MPNLIAHTHEICLDPDCELHHADQAFKEGTVDEDQLAFFIAGAQHMEMAIRRRLDHPAVLDKTLDDPIYSRRDLINAFSVIGRDLLEVASDS